MYNNKADTDNGNEDFFRPVRKITEVINEIELNEIQDEAAIYYMKKEIKSLKDKTQSYMDRRKKLEEQNVVLELDFKQLEQQYEISISSLTLKQQLRGSQSLLIDKCQEELDECVRKCQMNKEQFKQKYEDARKLRETCTPMYAEYKEAKTNAFKTEVRLKMLQQKYSDFQKELKMRAQVDKKLFNGKIIQFVRATVDYWKRKDSAIIELRGRCNTEVHSNHELSNKMLNVDNLSVQLSKHTNQTPDFEAFAVPMDINSDVLRHKKRSIVCQQDVLDQISLRIEEQKKMWLKEKSSLRRSSSVDILRNVKRPLGSIIDEPEKKNSRINTHTIDESKKIHHSSISRPSLENDMVLTNTVEAIPTKIAMINEEAPSMVERITPSQPMEVSNVKQNTTNVSFRDLPTSEEVGVTSSFFNQSRFENKQVGEQYLADSLTENVLGFDPSGPGGKALFNDEQYMQMSPISMSNISENMPSMMPSFINPDKNSDASKSPSGLPQFSFNPNQTTDAQQLNNPLSFFSNNGSNFFNMF